MTAVPPTIPVTTPEELTVAISTSLLPHEPPAVVSLNVMAAPAHTLPAPVIMPTVGGVLTVMTVLIDDEPHASLTV